MNADADTATGCPVKQTDSSGMRQGRTCQLTTKASDTSSVPLPLLCPHRAVQVFVCGLRLCRFCVFHYQSIISLKKSQKVKYNGMFLLKHVELRNQNERKRARGREAREGVINQIFVRTCTKI